jgi:hypothetical protein
MEHNTTSISPTNSSTAVYPNFYLSNKEYYGFAQVGNGSNSLYAVSSDALGRQDKTLVNGVTTTNFNNYKVIFTAGSLPSISNTGQIRATSITNGASPFTNSANIIDADANTYGYATYSYLKEIGLSWDGGTSWTGLTNIGSYSATKVTTVFANDKNTWWRSWSPSDFSNSNFVLRFTEMDGGGHNNKIANSIASDHHFDLKNFNFNTSGWVDITGIKVEVINETEDIGGPKVLIYDVLVTVYYTTAHGTGNIKYYVNDNLVATHYVAIPSSAGTGLFLEHNYSQGGGTTTSGSGEFKFFNNYKLRFDS